MKMKERPPRLLIFLFLFTIGVLIFPLPVLATIYNPGDPVDFDVDEWWWPVAAYRLPDHWWITDEFNSYNKYADSWLWFGGRYGDSGNHLGLWETRNHDPPPRKVDMHKYIQDIPEIKEKVYDDFSQLTPYEDDYSQVAEEQYS